MSMKRTAILVLGGLLVFLILRFVRSTSMASESTARPKPAAAVALLAPQQAPAPPAVSPPPTFTTRDPSEWQGMPIQPGSLQEECESPTGCGLAMACVSAKCIPCRQNADCAAGEVCAVQHCVLESNASCRSRKDCREKELCILSGYTATPRGNEEMTAKCTAESGGIPRKDQVFYRPELTQPMPVPQRQSLLDGL